MKKPHVVSVRLSDEMMDVIQAQVGKTISQKLVNLITRCMWEIPKKEQEIAELDKEIAKRKDILAKLDYNLTESIEDIKDSCVYIANKLELISSKM